MIRIALVEDDAEYRRQLNEYLSRYEKESGQRFHITSFADGDEITSTYKSDYDLMLMDIAMRFMDGMTAAEHIRKLDSEVVIIFITNTPQFVMRGYAVDALDYVLKPINYFAFSQRIDRAISRMNKRKKKYISVPIKGGVRKIDTDKIRYVEVLDHDLMYCLTDGKVSSRGTLTDVETVLDPSRFFRCSKCYIINLEFVDGIQNGCVIIGDTQIQVSRARKKSLLEALNDYLNEVSK